MATKRVLGVIGIFFVGIVLGVFVNAFSPFNFTGFFVNNQDEISSEIKNLYELVNPGVDISVVKIDEVSGLHKVLFKAVDAAGGTTYSEAYITQDGELLTENVILVEQSITQLNRHRDFVDCLASKNLRIAGITNHTATVLQFNALGGSYATKLYLSCDGDLVKQCVAANITQVPTVVYEDVGYPGVQTVQFFENLTGCKY